jgi:hypothetical protein
LTLQLLDNTTEYIETMPTNVQESAIMICYRESLSNLEKFNGGDGQKASQFINNIERIGKIIEANDSLLHCMGTAKLDGEAKRWYENNTSLTQWEILKSALLERFTASDPSTKIFEQLKERKQKPDETIASYYDAIVKLCHDYDPTMSQKMMISWLENGIKDSLKLQIKRQMKSLPEAARTTQTFLKIAKDEQELQEAFVPSSETTSYIPYFSNTVSTTVHETENAHPTTREHSYSSRAVESYPPKTAHQQRGKINIQQRTTPRTRSSLSQQDSFTRKPNSSNTGTRQFKPCFICKRNNHRTSDCYYKKPNGCYKCGQSDHHIRDCPQVFY